MTLFQVPAYGVELIASRLSGTSATVVVNAADRPQFVPWFTVNLHTTDTPNLTVDLYDGTNAHYLGDDTGSTWNAKALTAKQSIKFSLGYVVPKGWSLRVTSSDAQGDMHVVGTVLRPNE